MVYVVLYKGDDEYCFSDGVVICMLLIDFKLCKVLLVGVLVIVVYGDGYVLLFCVVVEKVCECVFEVIIVDYG